MYRLPKKYVKALTNVIFGIIVTILCIRVLPKILWLFMPFIIGWILSLIASPLVRFFEDKMKIKRKAGTALVIVAVITIISLGFYWIGAKVVEESYGFFNSIPQMWESAKRDFEGISQNMSGVFERMPKDMALQVKQLGEDVGQSVSESIKELGAPTVGAVGNFAKNIPGILVGVIISLLSAYFFVAEKDSFCSYIESHFSSHIREKGRLMKKTLIDAIGGYFKAQLKIEIWIYLIIVIGFFVLKIQYGLLLALGIAFLDILPIFGTGAVLIPWAIVKFLSGQYGFGMGLLIIWGVGQLTRQIIQPKIVGDSIGMQPIPTLVLLYVGYQLAGVLGMIAAVPLGILVNTMNAAGFFDHTKNSIFILWKGFNRFRQLEKQDLEDE